jgi:hypothetical protein
LQQVPLKSSAKENMKDRKEYYKQWRKEHPQRVKELNIEKNRVHNERYKKDPEYASHWKRLVALQRYKMTPEKYDAKLKEQEGKCAICGSFPKENTNFHVDHNHVCCDSYHSCGKCNRGLLCAGCNMRLGILELILRDAWVFPMLGRDQSWVAKALRYILKYEQVSPS